MSMNYILTDGGLHLIVQGKPVTLHKTDPHFQPVMEALKAKATPEEVMAILEAEKRKMEEAVQVIAGIELKGGQLYYEGEVIAGVLGSRMLQMLEEGFDLAPMAAFLANLQKNPSMRVVENLYPFLDHGKNPLTEDGCFLAYKAVNPDFTDIHSSKFDNSIGKVLEMPRNRVDENPSNTCSYGFHVCSFDYLPHFAHANGHVMVCKVNPADVVAIPADYNNTKMRVCKYEVVDEYVGYYVQPEDKLAAASVASSSRGLTFIVQRKDSEFGEFYEVTSFDRLSEAAGKMEELLDDSSVFSVRIENRDTGVTVDEQENDDFDDEGDTSLGSQDDDTYLVFRKRPGESHFLQIADDFDSVSDAASYALEDDDAGATYEVRDEQGNVMKTIS